jgi:cytosine/creatinine deaminase
MGLDHVFRNARIAGNEQELVDIGVGDGRFAAIVPGLSADAPGEDLGGRLVVAGFVETHIHLDKSCLLDRCACEKGTLDEAIAAVAAAKRAFTEDDVYTRASRTLEKAIV